MNREELLKVAKPILFNTGMVKALLNGRKTVTRRVINPKYCDSIFEMYGGVLCETEPETPPIDLGNGHTQHKVRRFVECKAPYKVGDILYVRETWQESECFDYAVKNGCVYRANEDEERFAKEFNVKWLPSIHMPKEAARIFLKIKDVRIDMICNMCTIDFLKEGIELYKSDGRTEKSEIEIEYEFEDLWNSTIKKQDLLRYGWDANPWVFVIEFERVEVDGTY